jgi:hypothetical protein
MKLPSDAVIAPGKIKEYLLSPRKRNDKSKWLAKAGYNLENWQALEKDLQLQILSLEAVFIEETKYGKMYEINGKLIGPNGRTISVRSFWLTEHETRLTKFITLFPGKS